MIQQNLAGGSDGKKVLENNFLEERDQSFNWMNKKLALLPFYIHDFIEEYHSKKSPNTLLNYLYDYIFFFNWLKEKKYHLGSISDLPLSTLENLKRKDIIRYENSLLKDTSVDTAARKLSSLKSLFHYLSQISEDDDGYPLLARNVMAKISITRDKLTSSAKAKKIEKKLLRNDEIFEFRAFVANGFGEIDSCQTNKRINNFYLKNKSRDLALISLILGSGVRLSEALGLNVGDIDWHKATISVLRKGKKQDDVTISDIALDDLREYLQLRNKNYGVDDSEKAVFLSSPTGPGGTVNRLRKRSATSMLDRYVAAYGKPLTMHKLRHTYATNDYIKNNDLAGLMEQLGHGDINTTLIYTHISNDKRRESVNKADS